MSWFDDADTAIRERTQAIAVDPTDTQAFLFHGEAFQRLNKVNEAIADLTSAIELTSHKSNDTKALAILVEAHICRGAAFGMQCNHDAAIADFTAAAQLDPKPHLAYDNRSVVYALAGNTAKAIEEYSKGIELNPNYPDAYLCRELTWKELGEHAKARADVARVREHNNQTELPKAGARMK